jgi:hypothetical protein
MCATRIGKAFKVVKDENGKTRLVPDEAARLAKLDVSTRLKVQAKGAKRVRYRKKGAS